MHPHKPARIRELREKLLEHLEAALAITDETGDALAGYLVESAIDHVRASQWPLFDVPGEPREGPT